VTPVEEGSSVGPSTWAEEPQEGPEEETEETVATERTEQTDEGLQPGASPTDVGYFLSVAGRYPLLTADREKELASILWSARRRLVQAIELARRTEGKTKVEAPAPLRTPSRVLSPNARRRLIAAEEYAERLLRSVGERRHAGEGFDRSLAVPPPMEPAPRRGRRSRNSVTPLLTKKQIRSILPMLRESLERIRTVREELVEHNLRLVVWVAKTYRGRGLDFVDLIQEGSLGLLRAIDRFDPAVGTRFSTFATHWVRQGIRRALAEKARTIRIPLNRLPEAREAIYQRFQLTRKLKRAPTRTEIAAEMGVPLAKVEELLPALSPIDSLDAPLASTDLRHADLLADKGTSPLEEAIEEETTQSIQALLDRMPERERIILAMRYGIGYPRECTLEEIGTELGLSRERIRQVEQLARRELRSLMMNLQPDLASS
jgi:RNA polymerase sigma factor (sigma-70 family)